MKYKSTTIQLIIAGFTESPADKIERLIQEDSTFREICADYAECIQMRDMYAGNTTDRDAPLYRQEYEALIKALEREISAKFFGTQQAHSASGEDRNLAGPSLNHNVAPNDQAGYK